VSWLNGRVVDLVVLVPVVWRALAGYRQGLFAVLYGLLGRLVTAFVAWREAPALLRWRPLRPAAASLTRWLTREGLALHAYGHPGPAAQGAAWVVRVLAFVLLAVVFQAVLQRVVRAVSQAVNRLPLVGSLNRLTGALAGAAGAALAMALLLVLVADAGRSWHWTRVLDAERRSAAAETLLPIGRSVLGWLLHGLPGTRRLLAGLPGLGA
jgi:uncharacterized membrane protein required for colicin V production